MASALQLLDAVPAFQPLPPSASWSTPASCSLLGSESNVVHSYAAIAVDRLLSMREPAAAGGGPRFQPQELASVLQVGEEVGAG